MRLPRHSSLWRLLLVFGCSLFCLLVYTLEWAKPLDRLVYDSASKLSIRPPSQDIVIIAIDERSLLELGRWPWAREKHVQLLRQLTDAGVAAVAMDIIFSEPDSEYPEVDQLLAEAMAKNSSVVLPVFIGQAHRGGHLFEVAPLPIFAEAAAGLGHVHVEVDSDGIVRSVFLKEGIGSPQWHHLSLALLNILGEQLETLPGEVGDNVVIKPSALAVVRSHRNYFPLGGNGLQAISYVDVLAGRMPLHTLKDKIVFVGATASGLGDNLSTPVGLISGVEINAFIFDALRNQQMISPLPKFAGGVVLLCLTASVIWFSTRLKPQAFLIVNGVIILLALLASILLLLFARWWLSPVPAMLSFLLAYPLWNWWRLEKAVAFLRQQLARLADYQNPEAFTLVKEELARGLQFLVSLNAVKGWQLFDESGNRICSGGSFDKALEEPCQGLEFTSQWQSQGALSFCQISRSDYQESCLSIIEWSQSGSPLQKIVDRIFPSGAVVNAKQALVESEIVERTIQQLSQAEQRVAEQRNVIDQSLDQLSSGVVLVDFGGHCLLINEEARHLLSVEHESLLLMELLDRIELRTEAWPELIQQLMFKSKRFSCEGVVQSSVDVLCHGSLIDLDTPLMLFNFVDISDLKRSQRNRTNALNFLSHDLRAPMTSVLALIEGARSEHPNEVNVSLLDNIQKYIERNLFYAENYTQLAKLEMASDIKKDEHDVHSLIDNAVSQLFHSAKVRDIQLQMPGFQEDIRLLCNSSMIERALVNLLDNAIKVSQSGDLIAIGIERSEHYLEITVTDQGSGIDGEVMDELFDRLSHEEHHAIGGGLGLKFVAAVARVHQGKVKVSSKPGEGAQFTLMLPNQVVQMVEI